MKNFIENFQDYTEEFVSKYFLIGIIILVILLITVFIIYSHHNNEQLIQDYTVEYKIDRKTAERRIRIDKNSGKNNSTYVPVVQSIPVHH